ENRRGSRGSRELRRPAEPGAAPDRRGMTASPGGEVPSAGPAAELWGSAAQRGVWPMNAPELDEFLPQLRNPDPDVRSSAAGALGAPGSDGVPAIAALYEACRDENMYVRGEALHSLVEITRGLPDAAAWPLLVAGVPTLTALLDDPW